MTRVNQWTIKRRNKSSCLLSQMGKEIQLQHHGKEMIGLINYTDKQVIAPDMLYWKKLNMIVF